MQEIDLSFISDKAFNNLSIKTIDKAIEDALAEIDKERSGEQLGLYSPFPRMNRAMSKYFRFSTVNLIFSLSGHGKSYFFNQLLAGLSNLKDIQINRNGKPEIIKGLNSDFKDKVLFIHCNYEMPSTHEILRMVSRSVQKSTDYLLSSEYDSLTETYNVIEDEQVTKILNHSKLLKGRPIVFLETSTSLANLYKFCAKVKFNNPNIKLVVSIDHVLLSIKVDEKDDNELMARTAYLALRLRQDFGAMVILLGQMNSEIKKPERKTNISFHHPMQEDVHGSKQLGWVCDNIWCVPYRPDMNYIAWYGVEKLKSSGLVVAAKVKSRYGHVGEIYLKAQLDKGSFIELDEIEVQERKKQ